MRTDARIVIAFDHVACGRMRPNAHHDAKIYEGTSEIQRLVIARHETGLR